MIFGFMKLVLLAGIIAIPITYFLMQEWMNDFAYRVGLHPVWFILGLLTAIVVALATIYSQAIKTVNKNPVDAIKHE